MTAARVVAAGALALVAASCGPDAILSYEDLVASGRLGAFPGAAPADEATCADETRFASALKPGTEVRLQVELGAAPTLGLAGCLVAPKKEGTEPAGAIELEIQGTGGLSAHVELPVSTGAWTARTPELEAFAESRAELRIRVRAPAGTRVLLSDLYLRHRVPPDAGTGGAGPAGSPPPRSPRPAEGPPVLLISLDTLRADALGESTPALTAFAETAETWSPHYAAASWTKPSHASLLTGYPVEVHGAAYEPQAIDPAVPTLAGRFRAAGYRAVGLVYDCEWLDAKWGFDRGFDEYRVMRWGADPAVRATADWISEHREEPFFYFLHLFTPHSDGAVLPYEATGVDRGTVAERFGIPDYGCREGGCASQLLLRLNRGLEPLPGEEQVLRYLYDRGVATTDAALGRLLRDLEEMDLLDRMVVVVTSDHGEAFFEHGKVLHDTMHREVIEVPLLIRWPGGRHAGTVRTTPSSALDLAPTLLAAAGIAAADLPGTPLHDRSRGAPIFSGTRFKAVVAGDAHAIFVPRSRQAELYHLSRDPREQTDLAASHPEEVARLRKLIARHQEESRRLRAKLAGGAGDDAQPETTLSEEERRRLEALGYVD